MNSQTKFSEKFDANKLFTILKNKDKYKRLIRPECLQDNDWNVFEMAQKYLDMSNNGEVQVSYFQTNGKHRWFANGSTSLQCLAKEIRHTIAKDFYVDIDIKNAHPVFLIKICKDLDIQCPILQEYNKNRDKYLTELMEMNQISREQAKKIFLALTNGGMSDFNNLKHKSDILNKYHQEMLKIRSEICEFYDDEYTIHVENRKANKIEYNHDGSFMNHLLCQAENDVLMAMWQYFGSPNDCVLCFDGIMLKKKDEEYDLRGCEKHIFKQTKQKIKLAIKEMNEGIEVEDIQQYSGSLLDNIEPFDRNDKYTWSKFTKEFGGKILKNKQEFETLVLPKMRKVFCYVALGSGIFIKKSDTFENLFDITDTNVNLLFEVQYYDDKSRLVTYNVKKIIKKYPSYFSYSKPSIEPQIKSRIIEENDSINLWTGYQAQLLDDNTPVNMNLINPILDIIRKVWCADDEEHYKGILKWLQVCIKFPEKITEVALVLVSEDKGVGKGFVTNFLRQYVLGNVLCKGMSSVSKATHEFNAHLMGKKLCIVNEMSSTKTEFISNFDKLKDLIDGKTIDIQKKGIDSGDVKNVSNWIFMSNHKNSMYLEKGDRRYICLECSPVYVQNRELFAEYDRISYNQEAGDHFYTYICRLQESEMSDYYKLLNTKLKKEMESLSDNIVERWLSDVVMQDGDENYEETEVKSYKAGDLFTYFNQWCVETNEKKITKTAFSRNYKSTLERSLQHVNKKNQNIYSGKFKFNSDM